MKKILFILLVCLPFLLGAQKVFYDFELDTVQGDETIYFTPGNDIIYFNGIVGFFFKATNSNGTVNYVILQGSYDATNYVNIDSISAAADGTYFLYDKIKSTSTLTTTTSDTVYVYDTLLYTSIDTCGGVSDTNTYASYGYSVSSSSNTSTYTTSESDVVANYLNYRLACDGGAADTCIYDPVIFIWKKEE